MTERTSYQAEVKILSVLFFCSGFPALIYQLTWQRALFRLFGVNIESVTIVVTAFMLGLGLGGLAGGWLSRRAKVPLLPLLAVIELSTAAFGLVSLRLFEAVGDGAAGWPLPVVAAVALALVLVPTLLMGATLPILAGHLVRRHGNVGDAVGRMYHVNTLGAAVSCLVAAVLLFPFLGMQQSVWVAAAINGAVAGGALAAHFRLGSGVRLSVPVEATTGRPFLDFKLAALLAALGGFTALSSEIFFFRVMSYATGGLSPTFAFTLTAFLLGLASGARVAGGLCRQEPEKAFRQAARMLMAAVVLGFLFLPICRLGAVGDSVTMGVIVLQIYLIARLWGVVLPLLAHLGVPPDDAAGQQIGRLYLANILGSASGAVLTGFVLMDRVGLVGLATVLGLLGVSTAALLAAAFPLPRRTRLAIIAVILAVGGLAAAAERPLAGDVLTALQWKGATADKGPLRRVIETRSGIISLTRDYNVYGNGMYDGGINTSLLNPSNHVIRAYMLGLYHPHPREVLMLGLASGSWAEVMVNHPEVEHLTIVEINPGYTALIAGEPAVAEILTNPKVTLIVDDARRWLRRNPEARFDAIVSNTTWHFRANSTNLLSQEFMGLVRPHLKPGGTFFYNTTDSARVLRTGCLAYPSGVRLLNHLLVSDSPVVLDFEHWRETLLAWRIGGRPVLDPAIPEEAALLDGLTGPPAPGAIESCAEILARSQGLASITDDNMGTEWRHPMGLEP